MGEILLTIGAIYSIGFAAGGFLYLIPAFY